MDIAFYISELLYENDCVIVPDLGGFVTHYVPAKIHPINHTFYPPGKNVLFNSKLTRDDGLLLDFISEKNNIPYAEAKRIVKEYVNEITGKLEKDGVVRLINVGTLHQDHQDKLLFDPDDSVNYLDDAFGLTNIISPAIIRKTHGKGLEKRFIDRKPIPAPDKRRKRAVAVVLMFIPVIFILGWLIFQNDLLPLNTQKSSMVSLEDKKVVDEEKMEFPEEIVIPPLKTLDFTEKPSNSGKSENKTTPADSKVMVKKQYWIIAGAFGIEDNADKLVGVLQKKGYDAERAGLSTSGLHMVSYFKTEDKAEALINLAIIRKEDNPSAWLLKK